MKVELNRNNCDSRRRKGKMSEKQQLVSQGQPGYAAGGAYGGPVPSAYGGQPPAGSYQGGQQAYAGYQQQTPSYQGYPSQGGAQGNPPQNQAGYPSPAGYGGQPQGPPPSGVPQYKGEMPADDVDDNPNLADLQPTAPPIDKMDTIEGYGGVGFNAGMLPPPSYDEATKNMGPPPERQNISNVPVITEQDAREALLAYVAEHCCYGKRAARDLQYLDLKSTSAFHYTLETFCEGRSTSWAYEPFTGQPIDTPMNGPAPGPWDIQAQPAKMFQNSKTEVEVPHTASVKIRCSSCQGSGHQTHYRDGHHHHDRCTWCHGNGRRMCYSCHGCGMVTCQNCKGHRQLKCYIKLTIIWTNHVADHIVERTSLPDHLIRNVSGQVAFEETFPRVWPINHFHEVEINEASKRIVTQQQFPAERQLMQRHRVRIIPVTQCIYKWSDQQSDYFVYGFEHKVYAPDYPQKCCCGCTVL
ncbi:hypothetical protein KUTeg_020218 [Tegillarca granosa]|uniref:Protein SSUH2 homolog n=1 Tax=Tegillarca granosa TaxID=220873 RepID=A0ABQ9E9Z1_TEGGR|nr:hypothetical protein KUTeg_020218 [Tegillarca granosa]